MTAFMAYLERKRVAVCIDALFKLMVVWCPWPSSDCLSEVVIIIKDEVFWFHWEYGVSVELAQDVCRVWIYTGLPDTATIQLSPLFLCMPPDNSRTIFNREETEPDSVVIGYFWMHSSWCTMGAVWPTISGTTKNIFPQWQIYCNY